MISNTTSVQKPMTMPTKSAKNMAEIFGISLVAVGIATILIASLLQVHTETRTDFVATYKSTRLGDFSISQKVTEFVKPEVIDRFIALAVAGGLGGACVLGIAAMTYGQLKQAEANLQAAMRQNSTEDSKDLNELQEEVRKYNMRVTALVPLAAFLIAMCIAAASVHPRIEKCDTYKWDGTKIWTPIGGWVKTGSFNAAEINTSMSDAMLKTGLVMTWAGVLTTGAAMLSPLIPRLWAHIMSKREAQSKELQINSSKA